MTPLESAAAPRTEAPPDAGKPSPPPAPVPQAKENPPAPFSQRYGPKEQEEKLRAALRLCGKTAFPDPRSAGPEFSHGQEDYQRRSGREQSAVFNIAGKILAQRGSNWKLDLGDIFPRAAQAMVQSGHPTMDFFLQFSAKARPVPLDRIRALLGQEDSTSAASFPFTLEKKAPITWHFYGWCGFGVDKDGTIIALKANCRAVKVDPRAAPLPVATIPRRKQPLHVLKHSSQVGGAVFAAGGAELISWEKNGLIRVWDVDSGDEKNRFPIGAKGDQLAAPLERAAPLGGARWLILAGGRAQVWDSAKGLLRAALTREGGRVMDWHINGPDSALLLVGDASGRVNEGEVFDLRRQVKLRSIGPRDRVPAEAGGPFAQPPSGHPRSVGAFSPDGRNVLWAYDTRMWLFDVATGKELHVFKDTGYVDSLAFSADGTRVLTGEANPTTGAGINGIVGRIDHAARVWKLKGTAALTTIPGSGDARRLASPYGQSLALANGGERALICWRNDKGASALELIEWGGDSSGLLDETPPPLPAASLTENFNLGGGDAPSPRPARRTIDSVLFAPDGRHAVSFGTGTEVRVWRFKVARAAIEEPVEKPRPKDVANPAEERAASALRTARTLLRGEKDAKVKELAKDDLKAILRKYPGTKAAKEAEDLLKEIE